MEHTPLVGRAAERTTLLAVVEAAATGSPGAVVLHGEPGIGKTRLVANVMAGLESHAWEVMLARCLRFSSDGTAFLPIGRALSGWLGSANPQVRAEVLSGATDLAAILPELGAPPAGVTGGRLVSLLATVFDRVSTLHPLVIVVDDLQWCDASSLDLLAHLIAGFRDGQRVALLATYRDSELGPGHLVHEWVADMRRMPRVSVLPLARLGRVETATLVRRVRAANLDRTSGDSRPPDPDEVYDRSQGNPYLTELIAAGDAAEGSSLPDALLGPWHRLSGHARVLTQALAVGGGPVPAPILRLIVPPAGPQPGTLGEAITEASAAGIAVVEGGSVWFRHPLLAEVIAQTIDPVTAARFHDAYVTVLQSASGLNELVRMGLLGQHLERAGRPSEAFVASIRAAEEAAQVHATAEESTHLQRAARLWPEAQATAQAQAGELPSLLERTCLAANRAGHFAACQTLAPAALNAVDAAADPLRASRLLLRLPLHLDHPGAATPAVIADRRRAVELAQPLGDTDELAAATAALAHSEFWHGIPTGRARAEYAVVVAERVGSAVTRAVAHLVHSQFIWYDREGLLEADRAWRQLRAHGDVLDWGPRAVLLLNCLEVMGDVEGMIRLGQSVLRDATRAGAPVMGTRVALRCAAQLIRTGRYDQTDVVLRQILARRQATEDAAEARAEAAILACRRGDLTAAGEHVTRIHELWAGRGPLGNDIGDGVLEYDWARGSLRDVIDTVLTDMPVLASLDPHKADERFLWGARAAADIAESGVDRTGSRNRARALLERVDRARGDVPPRFLSVSADDTIRPALAACHIAERARCLDEPDQSDRWADAYRACLRAQYPWEASWAAYQRSRALLRERGHRGEAAQALRESQDIATSLGAEPLLTRIAFIATQARVVLAAGPRAHDEDGAPGDLSGVGLTRREREVLAHVVAGRTYAEIGRRLFITEKTVSVHVSHIMAKTGTGSRVELAALATRPRPQDPG